jgi:tRNA-Thr(GGU) m(6)t(6)A37 methyltransferase TsaA
MATQRGDRRGYRRGRCGDRINETHFEVIPIGRVESPLIDKASAPKQGHEGSPDAWLVFEPGVLEGLQEIRRGDRVIVLTWLDRARRDVLRVHPRDDVANPMRGVFSTRSADRPNPIGLCLLLERNRRSRIRETPFSWLPQNVAQRTHDLDLHGTCTATHERALDGRRRDANAVGGWVLVAPGGRSRAEVIADALRGVSAMRGRSRVGWRFRGFCEST